jgi:nucleotide-binding universal stress UspA family protein
MTQVIVGMDESAGAAHALQWAVDEGAGRDWRIRAVLAWEYIDQEQLGQVHAFDPVGHADVAAKRLAAAVEKAVGPQDSAGIELEVVCEVPGPALVAAARAADADLLVVGARGMGGFKRLLVGSVSNHCLHHAPCPVVVVRDGVEPIRHLAERIVVGVDGSPASRDALRWALALARPGHARVEVVHAWQPTVVGGPFAPVTIDAQVWQDAADRTLDEVLAAEDTAGLDIARSLSCSGAAGAIVDAAQDADLVVVGSRTRKALSEALLGSVTRQVAYHAPCPVAVVHTSGA